MADRAKPQDSLNQMDQRELELPDTIYSRDIESRVFQSITLQCLSKIEGISMLGGTLIDNLLGREGTERIKGIYVEQDQKKHSLTIHIELNIHYGVSIPEKAEEIQTKVVEEVTHLTGLHVSQVHVIFKNLIVSPKTEEEILLQTTDSSIEEEVSASSPNNDL